MAALRERPEVDQLRSASTPVVLLIGDSGSGKTSVLQAAQRRIDDGVLHPAPVVCRFDDGALQNALLDGLAAAFSSAGDARSAWKRLGDQLASAAVETAGALARDLAKAWAKELLEAVKSRLGVNVGSGIAAFWKALTTNKDDELRRDIRSRSDANVVRLIVSLAETAADLLETDIVLALDEANRLSEDDQRVLASIAVESPRRVQIVAAWSSAASSSRAGIELLIEAGCEVVDLGGLSPEAVGGWLRAERVDASFTERVYQLIRGYPLLVEGLIAHLRAGEPIDEFTSPDVFVKVLDAALLRLTPAANAAARRLSAFVEPIGSDRIADYLGVSAVEWGTIRAALEHERILTVAHGDQLWFHEMRRSHLWNDVMDESERTEVAQAAFDVLLEEHRRRGGDIDSGMAVPIADLAPLATSRLAADPHLAAAVEFGRDELAVIAAAMELSSDNEAFIVTSDAVLIHARTTFGGADDLIDTLVRLADQGFLDVRRRAIESGASAVDSQRVDIAEMDPAVEVVVHGRIQSVLGRPAIPNVAGYVTRNHLEQVRLESTFLIIAAEESDTLDLIDCANMRRSFLHEPMLGLRLRFGDQPISVAAIFNTPDDRAAAITHARAADGGESAQRRITIDKILTEPTVRVASSLFLHSVWFATGLPEEHNDTKWWLRTQTVLPIVEFARRRVDCLRLVRDAATDSERDAMELDLPVGVGVADLGDRMFWIGLCGTESVVEVDPTVAALISSADPYLYSRLGVALGLTAGQRIRNFTEQFRGEPLIEDPVVDTLNDLWVKARRFNADQAPRKVIFEEENLHNLIGAAHVRMANIARRMSETLTIGGQRGHRDQRCLKMAVLADGDPRRWGGLVTVAAYPVGDPRDTEVRFVADRANIESVEEIYERAYGANADRTDLHAGTNRDMIASLLGHEKDEIQLYTR
jgi:hypothetical protein